jgi:hypothetical protein
VHGPKFGGDEKAAEEVYRGRTDERQGERRSPVFATVRACFSVEAATAVLNMLRL